MFIGFRVIGLGFRVAYGDKGFKKFEGRPLSALASACKVVQKSPHAPLSP